MAMADPSPVFLSTVVLHISINPITGGFSDWMWEGLGQGEGPGVCPVVTQVALSWITN